MDGFIPAAGKAGRRLSIMSQSFQFRGQCRAEVLVTRFTSRLRGTIGARSHGVAHGEKRVPQAAFTPTRRRARDQLLKRDISRASRWERVWFPALAAIVVAYALAGSLRPVFGDDPFFMLNDARWLVEHHEIPRVEHFSYTAQGQPWIYPVGGSLLFYGLWLVGGYALLSWSAALTTAGTTALLLRRESVISALLAALAVPLIAARSNVRADMFTTVLSAAYLALLWRHHQTGRGRLWLLPALMIVWVNAHLGFILGLGLIGGYVLAELLEFFWADRRRAAAERLRRAAPWLAATAATTVLNPFGVGIYGAVFRQLTAPQLDVMWEWLPVPLNWDTLTLVGSPLSEEGALVLLLIIAAVTAVVAAWRKEFGAAVLLLGAAIAAVQHIRSEALLATVTVIVGSNVLEAIGMPFGRQARPFAAALLAMLLVVLLVDMVPRKLALRGSWVTREYPEGAIAFIEREHIPAQILATRFGAYFTWRLWPKYPVFWDARTVPFGPELLARLRWLAALPPTAPGWHAAVDHFGINAVLAVAGPNGFRLQEFCTSDEWIPVYLDEVSAIFVRRRPENAGFEPLRIDCSTPRKAAD